MISPRKLGELGKGRACYKDSIQEQEAAAIKKWVASHRGSFSISSSLSIFKPHHKPQHSGYRAEEPLHSLVLSVLALNKLMLQALNDGMKLNNEDTNRSYSVDGTGEAVIGYGSVPGFDWPQRLAATHKEAAEIHYWALQC